MRYSVLFAVLCVACTKTTEPGSPTPNAPQRAEASSQGDSSQAAPSKADSSKAAAPDKNPLLDVAAVSQQAPAKYTVRLETTKGDILIDVTRDWAPRGADRFYSLVKAGFYDDVAFFRVIGGFMAQVGISGDGAINRVWRTATIDDDPVKESNKPGYVSFATSGPNSRTTQFFINYGDNSRLDGMGFSPFGKLQEESLKVAQQLHAGYGEGAPRGRGPDQGRLQQAGNAYLRADFPELDYIRKATVVE